MVHYCHRQKQWITPSSILSTRMLTLLPSECHVLGFPNFLDLPSLEIHQPSSSLTSIAIIAVIPDRTQLSLDCGRGFPSEKYTPIPSAHWRPGMRVYSWPISASASNFQAEQWNNVFMLQSYHNSSPLVKMYFQKDNKKRTETISALFLLSF